jgi:hypothetical protein
MARQARKETPDPGLPLDKSKDGETSRKNFVTLLVVLVFFYFAVRIVYFAVEVSPAIPPDEDFHFGRCEVYSRVLLLPADSEDTYALGPVTGVPWLYYFIMGKLLALNPFPVSDLVFLRLANGALALLTVFTGYLWVRLLTPNPLCPLLFILLLTNTPMFSFLSASVSYDNLTNLLAAASLYFLHRFLHGRSPAALASFVVCILSGTLTKKTFIPLVPVLLFLLLFHERKNLKALPGLLLPRPGTASPGRWVLSALAVLLLILNGTLYLGNYARYGTFVPWTGKILGNDHAMNFRIYARDNTVSQYRSGGISYEEALRRAEAIPHPGDRMDALYLLDVAKRYRENPFPLMNRAEYVPTWLTIVLNRTVGIFGHLSLRKYSYPFAAYVVIYLVSLVLLIRYWRPDDGRGMVTDAFLLTVFYAVVLMQWVNYPIYLSSLTVGKAVHGRYLFPVIVPLYGMMSFYLLKPFGGRAQAILLAAVSLYFLWGDFPYFLTHAGPEWFQPGPGGP